MTWLDAAYTGKAPLWRTFWLVYALGLLAVCVAAGLIVTLTGAPLMAVALVALFHAFAMVALWRCAPNASHRGYTLLARIWAGFIGVGLVGMGLRAVGA